MKIITSGGGIDANGNPYTLPEIEREVPDDYFVKLRQAFVAIPKPTVMFVPPGFLDSLKDS